MLTFPLWGVVLLVFICAKFSIHGTLTERAIRALVMGLISSLLFTPGMWGTEGFGLFVPWWAAIFDRKNTIVAWQLAVPVFIVASAINFATGKGSDGVRNARPDNSR